jgi:hypothetical protein
MSPILKSDIPNHVYELWKGEIAEAHLFQDLLHLLLNPRHLVQTLLVDLLQVGQECSLSYGRQITDYSCTAGAMIATTGRLLNKFNFFIAVLSVVNSHWFQHRSGSSLLG